ncbi:unnamed protein product [Cyclocybe aegerita]|uniref:Uncharacterized protein n=1 Tax=Cyclocybe aegerita TaxID=1973307 RepID=A0A8S0WB80_CYCAE|nr:unnamed protein product [Cyclocybe aegerita]
MNTKNASSIAAPVIPETKEAHAALIAQLEQQLEVVKASYNAKWSAAISTIATVAQMAASTPSTFEASEIQVYDVLNPSLLTFRKEPVIPGVDLDAPLASPPAPVSVSAPVAAPVSAARTPMTIQGAIYPGIPTTVHIDGTAIVTVSASLTGQGTYKKWHYDILTNSVAPPAGSCVEDLDKDLLHSTSPGPVSSSSSGSGKAASTSASDRSSRRTSPYTRTARATSAPPTFTVAAPAAPSSAPTTAAAPPASSPAAAQARPAAPRRLRREDAVTHVHTRFGPVFVSNNYAQAELGAYRKPKGVKSTFSHFLHDMPRTAVPVASGSDDDKGKKRARDDDEDDDSGLGSEEERPKKKTLVSDEFDSPATCLPGNHVRVRLHDPATGASMTPSSPRRRSPRLQAENN